MPKQNIPNVNDLVIADIYDINEDGAYCKLIEYNNLTAFLPVREVASGWIKNIREFIHKGQRVVCRVIYADKEKGIVSLSLKKVTPSETKAKLNEYNTEKRFEGLFKQAAKLANIQELDKQLEIAREEFGSITEMIYAIENNRNVLKRSKLDSKLKESLVELINKIKRDTKKVIRYTLNIYSLDFHGGFSKLKDLLSSFESNGVSISYAGASKYLITAEGKSYDEAEDKIKAIVDSIESKKEEYKLEYSIKKEKVKESDDNNISKLLTR
ncbi:MAG: translation initiation factor IF-2 subunit alpha [Candidatus Micrarchaeota archaeon]|nr:MAG: translation initiation factor IF-2 subunit alpha [Candidatus Micrarchaeota archaeon]